MSARDELAEVLWDVRRSSPHETADAILAAGYVKVSEAAIERAVESLAELEGCKVSQVHPRRLRTLGLMARAVVAALREGE